MKPKSVQAPTDVVNANNWTFEIPGSDLVSPNFARVDGINRSVETVQHTDGGSGLTYKFHGGIVNYGDPTIVRIRDNSADDDAMSAFVDDFIENGTKVNGTLVKRHRGEIIRKINFIGLQFKEEQFPGMDNSSANPMEMSYPCTVDYWEDEKV